MDSGVRCHGMKANPIGYLWSKCECFLTTGCQDIDFCLEGFPLPLGAWDGLRYFIVALPESSINFLENFNKVERE